MVFGPLQRASGGLGSRWAEHSGCGGVCQEGTGSLSAGGKGGARGGGMRREWGFEKRLVAWGRWLYAWDRVSRW